MLEDPGRKTAPGLFDCVDLAVGNFRGSVNFTDDLAIIRDSAVGNFRSFANFTDA